MVVFTNIITLILLPLLFLIKNCSGVAIFNNDTRKYTPKTNEINDSIGNGIFFIVGIITSFANVIGCLMIIVITFNTRKERKQKNFSASQEFPFYMSMMDIFIALVAITNLIYPIYNYNLLNSGILCEI